MEDILYTAALEYEKLLAKGYHILLGRKCKIYILNLRFKKADFFHLAGLQHLTDITFSSKNKERIFKNILSRKISNEMLKKSVFYEKFCIEERIANLKRLEEMLDSNQFMFLINHKEYLKYTKIYADYLCEYFLPENQKECLYFFTVKVLNPVILNEVAGCSFFKKHEIDYTKGTSETKLLLNQKLLNYGTSQEKCIELYRHPKYKEI